MTKRGREPNDSFATLSPLARLLDAVNSIPALEIICQSANKHLAATVSDFLKEPQNIGKIEKLKSFGWNGSGFTKNLDLLKFSAFLKKCNYPFLEELGKGSYARVYKGRNLQTDQVIALKKVKYDQQCSFSSNALREISILRTLEHENIVKLLDIIGHCNSTSLYLVLEYLDCNLSQYMYDITDKQVKSIIHQVIKGAAHMHDNLVIHRDLKPQNILVNRATAQVKIADFGLSREYLPPHKNYTEKVVTLSYRAPELLLGFDYYSTPVDMWSIGCILAELCNLKVLFSSHYEIGLLYSIFEALGTPTVDAWPELCGSQHLIMGFPRFKGKALAEIVPKLADDPGGLDLLGKLLTYDPHKRITAAEALQHPWFKEDAEFRIDCHSQSSCSPCSCRISSITSHAAVS